MFCDNFGATLTANDVVTCFLYNSFGGDFTIFAVVVIAVFMILAYKFHLSSTIGLALAWPILLFLFQLSDRTNYAMSAMLVLVTIAIGIKVFFAVLARFQK